MEVWFIIFGSVLSVVGAIGNGLVVLLIARYRRLHSPANWFVVSLAVADFAVGIVVFPSSYVCNGKATTTITCNMKIHNAAYWFFVNSSIANLCILTWNRYTFIVHPFKYISSMTARHPGRVILLAWLIPLMISLSFVLGMYVTSSLTAWKVLRLTGVSGFDILSCSLLIYAVVRILVVVRAQSLKDSAMRSIERDLVSSQLQDQVNNISSAETVHPSGRKHNSARFVIAVVVFFLGCQVAINYLVLRYMFVSERPKYVGLVVTIFLIANSAVNPFVYAFLKQDMKHVIARLIFRKYRESKNSERSGNLTQMSVMSMRVLVLSSKK